MAKKVTIIKNRPLQILWLPGIVDVHLGHHESLYHGVAMRQEVKLLKGIDVVAVGFCEAKNHRDLIPEGVDGNVTSVHYYEADQ